LIKTLLWHLIKNLFFLITLNEYSWKRPHLSLIGTRLDECAPHIEEQARSPEEKFMVMASE
jgi:hypothetical protein